MMFMNGTVNCILGMLQECRDTEEISIYYRPGKKKKKQFGDTWNSHSYPPYRTEMQQCY